MYTGSPLSSGLTFCSITTLKKKLLILFVLINKSIGCHHVLGATHDFLRKTELWNKLEVGRESLYIFVLIKTVISNF